MDKIINALTEKQKNKLLKKYIESEYKKDCFSCNFHEQMMSGNENCMHYCMTTSDRYSYEPNHEYIIKDIIEGETKW